MTYAEAVARILGLRGGERAGMRPGLERIEALLDAIDRPEQAFTIAQVGGTNGKGSISAMLAAVLQASGRRVGLYTSPHLRHYRERIRVDGRPISEADFVDGVEALGTLIARLDATVFEAGTALALDHFCRSRVDVAVLEVGLGGRLDATTVGRPAVVALGPIDYDHQRELGDTLTAIAGEKAAIIRSGVAFTARQDPAAAAVLERRAAQVGVPLAREGHELSVSPRGFTLEAQRLDLAGPGWRLPDVACGLLGVFQPGNALLAAAAGRALGADEAAIRAGLRGARWPGRFQVFRRDPVVILDGAHNPAGCRILAGYLRHHQAARARRVLLFAVMRDKPAAEMLSILRDVADEAVVTTLPLPRATPAPDLERLARDAGLPATVAPDPAAALAVAARHAGKGGLVVACGSLYLVGALTG